MATKKIRARKRASNGAAPAVLNEMAANEFLLRSQLLQKMLDPRRDIDNECGYPKEISTAQYKLLYDREGIANRVVRILPEECWRISPTVYETEDPEDKTEFEKAFDNLELTNHIWHYLRKVDELSGVGRFGILLLGLDDGANLSEPAPGINPDTGEPIPGERSARLLYLRAFEEHFVQIASSETDTRSPRFGKPKMYNINFVFDSTIEGAQRKDTKVHWTRVIHVADNTGNSEVFGVPRIQIVYNRMYDLRKILGGSGEMFWKGGFPGISLESLPDVETEFDIASIREQMTNYQNGLQRYLALQNITAKSLAPVLTDGPDKYFGMQIDAVCIAIGVPKRIFLGSERGELASGQDAETWNNRLMKRQRDYLSPMLVAETVNRFIALGVLPSPTTPADDEEGPGYVIEWPDLNSQTDEKKAENAKTVSEAIAKYLMAGGDALIPPMEFLTLVLGFEDRVANQILEAAEQRLAEIDETQATEPQGQTQGAEAQQTEETNAAG